MASKGVIRGGFEKDLESLTRIYNHYVEHSSCTFDTEVFSVEERRPWFERFGEKGLYRLFVLEQEGKVLGYACSGPFRPKPAYRSSVETSVYLEPGSRGRGFGRALLAHLLEALAEEPLAHRAYAGIVLPGEASVRLHESLGYGRAAHYHEVGYKLGSYHDVAWYERDLSIG